MENNRWDGVPCRDCGVGWFLKYRGCEVCGRDVYKRNILNFYKESYQESLSWHLASLTFGPDELKLSEAAVRETALRISDSMLVTPGHEKYWSVYKEHLTSAVKQLLEVQ